MSMATALVLMLTMLTPPSGRPPIGPLQRHDPKLYDLTFDVTLNTVIPRIATDRKFYRLEDAPIVMPVIFQGAYSRVHQDSLRPRLWLLNNEDQWAAQNFQTQGDFPHHTHLMKMFIREYQGASLRWQLSYRIQVWSSKLDEQWAARLTWPEQWPDEVRDGLVPSQFIESDDPIFAQSVQRLTNGNLKLAPPYLAAKEIIRYTISRFQVSGNGTDRGEGGVIRGLNVKGARAAWENGLGSEHDLVCTCVAMLRAANIPARPVIGVTEEIGFKNQRRKEFVSWGEFYMQGAGWIPFDPEELRGKAINNRDLRAPWPELGVMDDLNERIPLAYSFLPDASVEAPWKPCVWGWDPRPGGDPSTFPVVSVTIISRGRGEEDPR